jgi:hypothetical protein
MLTKRFAAALLLGGATLSFASSAFAAPFKDTTGSIYIQDAAPNTSVQIQTGELSRKVTANFCGLVTVSVPTGATMPASITVGTDAIDTTTLPVQTIPRCVDNALAEARPANFKDASGRVVVVGKTPGVGYQVTYPGVPANRSLSSNACGFIKISNSVARPAPTSFTYLGTAYDTASLPTQTPARCIDGIKFVPQP